MKIIVDAFGGDNAPKEIIKGSALAAEKLGVDIIICGKKEDILKVCENESIDPATFEIVDASEVISNDDDAVKAIRTKKDSSMVRGLELLTKNQGDAFVSAGSTGALLAGGTFIVKRIKGVKRAARSPIIPCAGGQFLLIDCGANVVCQSNFLEQFAVLGSIYVQKLFDVKNPRVGLLNNGAEESKGTDLQVETFKLLKESGLNFIGNVEGRDAPMGICDVLVTDGFTGNIFLKTVEGTATMITNQMKQMFKSSPAGMLSALMLKGRLKWFKASMDYNKHGGAPLLGLSKPVIKAHGSANAECFFNAVRQAVEFKKNDVISVFENHFSQE